jgi:aminopeptidase YwaD
MKRFLMFAVTLSMFSQPLLADLTELIPESTISSIAQETSGVSAKRNLDTITLYHRTRASSQFREAADHVLMRLREYGLDTAEIIEYAADGKTMFGTQKSRPAWDVDFAELWELNAQGERVKRHGSWEAMPLSVAQDSISGQGRGLLVDIGAGASDEDYAGKAIKGTLVLTSSQPDAVVERAVGELGALGIVSYAPNQKTAWWKEDDRLVRWGHMGTFAKTKGFGFMISLGVARQLQQRLDAGEDILFDAEVRGSQKPGKYSLVSAVIPGANAALESEEIIYTCHLDHPRPGANDNASGCVSILEAARVLKHLVDKQILPVPKRSIRFIWPAEIEGSLIYLNTLKDTSQIKANIHLDMVGGGEETKSVFRVSGGPMSIPSFISDVAHEIGSFVNDQTLRYASGEDVAFPLVSKEGSKNPQLAQMEGISLGSDHQVFNEASWAIPGIYLHDWPDRYIHTNFDSAAMIDPTKLKRAAFIAAMQGWYLANFDEQDVAPVLHLLRANALQRAGRQLINLSALNPSDQRAVAAVHATVEVEKVKSIAQFSDLGPNQLQVAQGFISALGELTYKTQSSQPAANTAERVYRRNPDIKGPMHAFDYSFLEDRFGIEKASALALQGAVAYEALNLVDGQRSVSLIRSWLLAEFTPAIDSISLENVEAYLAALETIDVIQ